MAGKKTTEKKDTTKKRKQITRRHATEEDYRKLNYWNVGTYYRASDLPKPEPSSGKEQPQQNPPHCPQELVKALKKQGVRVKLPGPLEERLQNDLMMEGLLGKGPKKK